MRTGRRIDRVGRRRGQGQTGQSGKRFRARLLHDRSPVILHRPLADAEIGRDVLARMASQDQLPFFASKTLKPALRTLSQVQANAVKTESY